MEASPDVSAACSQGKTKSLKSLQPSATGHYQKSTIVHLSGAEPLPHGKESGTRRVRHFTEIHNNFVNRLLSGTFGWPPLRRRPPLRLTNAQEGEENRVCHKSGSMSVKVDCRDSSCVSGINELKPKLSHMDQRMASNEMVDCRFGIKSKRRSLQEVRHLLSQAMEETEVHTSRTWQKWKRERSKPPSATTDNAEPSPGDSIQNTGTISTTTTNTTTRNTSPNKQTAWVSPPVPTPSLDRGHSLSPHIQNKQKQKENKNFHTHTPNTRDGTGMTNHCCKQAYTKSKKQKDRGLSSELTRCGLIVGEEKERTQVNKPPESALSVKQPSSVKKGTTKRKQTTPCAKQ